MTLCKQLGSSASVDSVPSGRGSHLRHSSYNHRRCHSGHTPSRKGRRQFLPFMPPPSFQPPVFPPAGMMPPFLPPGMPQQLPQPSVSWLICCRLKRLVTSIICQVAKSNFFLPLFLVFCNNDDNIHITAPSWIVTLDGIFNRMQMVFINQSVKCTCVNCL